MWPLVSLLNHCFFVLKVDLEEQTDTVKTGLHNELQDETGNHDLIKHWNKTNEELIAAQGETAESVGGEVLKLQVFTISA